MWPTSGQSTRWYDGTGDTFVCRVRLAKGVYFALDIFSRDMGWDGISHPITNNSLNPKVTYLFERQDTLKTTLLHPQHYWPHTRTRSSNHAFSSAVWSPALIPPNRPPMTSALRWRNELRWLLFPPFSIEMLMAARHVLGIVTRDRFHRWQFGSLDRM